MDNMNESSELAPSTFTVDTTLKPRLESVPGLEGDRERVVASLSDIAGTQADFVEGELIVIADDPKAVDEIAQRWNGSASGAITFTMGEGGEMPDHYLVVIDLSKAEPEKLAENARKLDSHSRNDIRISSDAGHRTLAAAMQEAVTGALIGLNWILLPTAEGPSAPALPGGTAYHPEPHFWPYMRGDGAQRINVVGAWERLREAGQLANPVSIAILDAGFSLGPDLPSRVRLIPPNANNVPNPWPTSTGGAAPWHGTNAASAAAAVAANSSGSAGPAGALSALSLLLVQSPSPDIFSIVRYVLLTLPEALVAGPRIVNISAEVSLPAVVGVLGQPVATLGWTLRRIGMLVFAAAGNQGQDIDALDCFGACWERTWWLPVETAGVIGVGGLAENSSSKHDRSNFGTERGGDTVDIFGPWDVWVGPDPATPGNGAHPVGGTSFASPFVAGVAALVWAARPQLTPDEVESILIRSANTGSSDSRVPRWVNANRAVLMALGWDEETGWRWCRKCQGLWNGGSPSSCPGGGGHERAGSGDYALIRDSGSYPGQPNWRRCFFCGLLWFSERPGRCHVTRSGHLAVRSPNYRLGASAGQPGWRWCHRCEGLFWFGAGNRGACASGGGHGDAGSGAYRIVGAASSPA